MDRPLHILLVEDDPADARLTAEALREAAIPHQLVTLRDGMEALAYLRRQDAFATAPRPDLILTDLNLPRLSGHELLSIIKEDTDLQGIPVVMFTTSAAPGDVQRAYQLHVNAYITKPADVDQFFAVFDIIKRFWGETAQLPRTE